MPATRSSDLIACDDAGGDDARQGDEHSAEEKPGQACDGVQVAIQKGRHKQAGCGGDEIGSVEERQGRDQVTLSAGQRKARKAGEADASGGDRKRGGETELPDIEERNPAAGSLRGL